MTAGKVVIAQVHKDDVAVSYHNSIMGVTLADMAGERRLLDTGGTFGLTASFAGPMQIPKARNDCAARFLELHPEADWLWFLDSDMGVDADALEMLLASADPQERPVVGGLCFAQKVVGVGAARAFRTHFLPTVYRWNEHPNSDFFGFDPIYDYPRDQLVQCAGTGAACILIHRTVLERMAERFGPDKWFEPVTYRDRIFSEDMSFCLRLILMEIPLFVNTAVKTSHAKTVWIDEEYYDLQRSAKGGRKFSVVVPVKDQLEMTRDILRQVQQQGGYEQVIVCDNGSDTETAEWLAGQDVATVVDCAGLNIHEMWNRGIDLALEDDPDVDVAILNNDLRLGPDCLTRMCEQLHTDPYLLAVSANYDGRGADTKTIPVRGICAGRYDGTGGFAGFAFMVRNDLLKSYRFPEELVWWYGDNDLLLSIEANGAWYGIVRDAHVEHLDGGSVTTRAERPDGFAEQIDADRDWFRNKWDVETVSVGTDE